VFACDGAVACSANARSLTPQQVDTLVRRILAVKLRYHQLPGPPPLGRFSLVSLWAHEPMSGNTAPLRQADWYTKTAPSFRDAGTSHLHASITPSPR
jgi:hypothetical protein